MEYKDNMGAMEPLRVHTVVISVQHSPDITLEEIDQTQPDGESGENYHSCQVFG